MIRLGSILATVAAMSGCASWGDFVAPPHDNSAWSGSETTCIKADYQSSQKESGTSAVLAISGLALEWAYDGLLQAAEIEAGRYSAAHSARLQTAIYRRATDADSTSPWNETETASKPKEPKFLVVSGLEYSRFAPRPPFENQLNDECVASGHSAAEFRLSFAIQRRSTIVESDAGKVEGLQYRLVPTSLAIQRVKAKVPDVSWWRPWTWALLAKPEYASVDINARVELNADVIRDGARKTEVVAEVDFPFGRIELPSGDVSVSEIPPGTLSALASNWFQLPAPTQLDICPKESCQHEERGMLNVAITVTESNDLGVVMSKEVERSRVRKEERIESALEKLKMALED